MDLRATFWALVREIVGQPIDAGASPEYLLLGRYRATVVSQNGDGTLEVQAEDPRIGGMKNVRMRVPIPNCVVQVAPGAVVLLCFEGGNRKQAYCAPEWESGATLTALSIGGSPDNVVTKADIAAIKAAISATVVVAQDGGASFKATLLSGWPAAVGSTTIKVQR